ncbi:MAG: hypothetical protein LDL24_08580 [Treponema sp.]|nr:hypothetical protein [Treponema sp.]
MKRFSVSLLFLVLSVFSFAQEKPLKVNFEAESGALKVLYHTYRVGANGTNFNFVNQGGQEILFPFERITASLSLYDQHQVRFLYQSLELATEITARSAFTIDTVTFGPNDVVNITYSFPFYRFTYLYDLLPGPAELSLGGALQFRNASIRFTSVDGSKRAVSQNLGLVPALALSGKFPITDWLYAGFDMTGIYASSAFINGADFNFEGSLLDASVRAGVQLRPELESFVNLRFIGGSAAGVSQYPNEFWTQSTEKDTANYLATLALTIGGKLSF